MPFSSSPKLPAIDTFCVLLAGGQGTWLHKAAPFADGSKLGDLPRGGTALVATAVLERYREEHPRLHTISALPFLSALTS